MLGTPAGVRILRALSLHHDVMSQAMIAERTGLGGVGAGRALKRLVAANAVEAVGDLRRPQYRLSLDSRLVADIRRLFEAEAERTDGFLQQLRQAVQELHPAPEAVWLIGSVARREDTMLSDIDVAMVWSGIVQTGLKLFNQAIYAAASPLGIHASILTLSLADVRTHAAANDEWWQKLTVDAVPILGPAPRNLVND